MIGSSERRPSASKMPSGSDRMMPVNGSPASPATRPKARSTVRQDQTLPRPAERSGHRIDAEETGSRLSRLQEPAEMSSGTSRITADA